MRKSYQDYKEQGTLKIKHFIFNTIYDTNTVSFEEIYQLTENFVHLNDTKKLNKKIINYVDRYLSKYEEQLQHTVTCSTKRIITLNDAILRLKKCQLALYPLIARNAADPDFVNSYCHDYMTSYISNHLESIQNDIVAFLGSENSIQKFTFISEIVKICKTFCLYSEISKIMVDVNVATNIKKLHCIFDRDALESIDYIANYFAEQRKMDHLREFMYDIEKNTLQNILKNISAFDKKVFSDTIRFYHLFSFYFTANMKSEFFTHLSAHLNTFWISHDDNVLNRLYRCIVSAIWIIKNTDYNSEVVDFVDQYLTSAINDDVNLPRFLIEKINECLLTNSNLHEQYFLVHLIDTENHTFMRTYKKEAEHYLQKYSTICDTNDCFEPSYDIFYYIVANLKEKSQSMSAYETYAASRLLFASDYIEKENKMIDNYKPYTTYNHFYKVERMIKDLQNIYSYKNTEIYTLNAYLWRISKTFDFDPGNELNEIIESFLETKDTETFTYRFVWNLSQCDVEIDGHDITMSVSQYQIVQYVINTQPTKEEFQNQFKSCDISLELDALCKYGFLVILDNFYHFSNSFDREVKNIMPLDCGNVANLFDHKKEINNSCIIESKILLNIRREKSIKEKRLVELVARSLNMKEDEVKIVIDTLKQNGKLLVNNDAIIVVNGK